MVKRPTHKMCFGTFYDDVLSFLFVFEWIIKLFKT